MRSFIVEQSPPDRTAREALSAIHRYVDRTLRMIPQAAGSGGEGEDALQAIFGGPETHEVVDGDVDQKMMLAAANHGLASGRGAGPRLSLTSSSAAAATGSISRRMSVASSSNTAASGSPKASRTTKSRFVAMLYCAVYDADIAVVRRMLRFLERHDRSQLALYLDASEVVPFMSSPYQLLHYAVCSRSAEMLQLLLYYDGDLQKVFGVCNLNAATAAPHFMTPLSLAVSLEDFEMVRTLIAAGAQVRARRGPPSHRVSPLQDALMGLSEASAEAIEQRFPTPADPLYAIDGRTLPPRDTDERAPWLVWVRHGEEERAKISRGAWRPDTGSHMRSRTPSPTGGRRKQRLHTLQPTDAEGADQSDVHDDQSVVVDKSPLRPGSTLSGQANDGGGAMSLTTTALSASTTMNATDRSRLRDAARDAVRAVTLERSATPRHVVPLRDTLTRSPLFSIAVLLLDQGSELIFQKSGLSHRQLHRLQMVTSIVVKEWNRRTQHSEDTGLNRVVGQGAEQEQQQQQQHSGGDGGSPRMHEEGGGVMSDMLLSSNRRDDGGGDMRIALTKLLLPPLRSGGTLLPSSSSRHATETLTIGESANAAQGKQPLTLAASKVLRTWRGGLGKLQQRSRSNHHNQQGSSSAADDGGTPPSMHNLITSVTPSYERCIQNVVASRVVAQHQSRLEEQEKWKALFPKHQRPPIRCLPSIIRSPHQHEKEEDERSHANRPNIGVGDVVLVLPTSRYYPCFRDVRDYVHGTKATPRLLNAPHAKVLRQNKFLSSRVATATLELLRARRSRQHHQQDQQRAAVGFDDSRGGILGHDTLLVAAGGASTVAGGSFVIGDDGGLTTPPHAHVLHYRLSQTANGSIAAAPVVAVPSIYKKKTGGEEVKETFEVTIEATTPNTDGDVSTCCVASTTSTTATRRASDHVIPLRDDGASYHNVDLLPVRMQPEYAAIHEDLLARSCLKMAETSRVRSTTSGAPVFSKSVLVGASRAVVGCVACIVSLPDYAAYDASELPVAYAAMLAKQRPQTDVMGFSWQDTIHSMLQSPAEEGEGDDLKRGEDAAQKKQQQANSGRKGLTRRLFAGLIVEPCYGHTSGSLAPAEAFAVPTADSYADAYRFGPPPLSFRGGNSFAGVSGIMSPTGAAASSPSAVDGGSVFVDRTLPYCSLFVPLSDLRLAERDTVSADVAEVRVRRGVQLIQKALSVVALNDEGIDEKTSMSPQATRDGGRLVENHGSVRDSHKDMFRFLERRRVEKALSEASAERIRR